MDKSTIYKLQNFVSIALTFGETGAVDRVNEHLKFDIAGATNDCIQWIKDWIETNCPGHKVVIGLSGGKDSTIMAALLARALGAENVIGVGMPGNNQGLNEAEEIAAHLGIKFYQFSLGQLETDYAKNFSQDLNLEMSAQTKMNIPPRLRMTTLYAIAQSVNGVVVNTCNLSEDYIGYSTLFGDCAGSFAPLRQFTATEIIAIGDYLGLPEKWVHKVPDDGLPGSSPDEEKFGFTYKVLDKYVRFGRLGLAEKPGVLEKIEKRHYSNLFKLDIVRIPSFAEDVEIIEKYYNFEK